MLGKGYKLALIMAWIALPGSPQAVAEMVVGGARPALLLAPDPAQHPADYPLIVFLHGFTSNAAQSDRYLGISARRDELGFAVLLPDGTPDSQGRRFWNATPECCDFDRLGVDDVQYLRGIIDESLRLLPINPSRVLLIGHSNGAFMSFRMACEVPERLFGIVTIAGLSFKDQTLCRAPAPINILHIHGTLDETVPYAGSDYFPSVDATLDYFRGMMDCSFVSYMPESRHVALNAEGDSNEVDEFTWTGCRSDKRVGLWKMQGVTHVPYFTNDWLNQALAYMSAQGQ